jgi:hypothetical protein
MTNVFLSYSKNDYSFAHRLRSGLRDVTVKGWMDEADIAAGTAISSRLRSAIQNSTALLVLISPSALHSRWVDFEVGAGLALGKPIIPILVEGVVEKDLPEPLKGIEFIDARNQSLEDAISAIEKRLSAMA